jgi:hypothetical protein
MKRGKQLYMDSDVWDLVEESAKKDKRSTNKWIEILLIAHFLKDKIKKS